MGWWKMRWWIVQIWMLFVNNKNISSVAELGISLPNVKMNALNAAIQTFRNGIRFSVSEEHSSSSLDPKQKKTWFLDFLSQVDRVSHRVCCWNQRKNVFQFYLQSNLFLLHLRKLGGESTLIWHKTRSLSLSLSLLFFWIKKYNLMALIVQDFFCNGSHNFKLSKRIWRTGES